jgi:hypothetical protein
LVLLRLDIFGYILSSSRLDIFGYILSSSRLDIFGYILLLSSCCANAFSNAGYCISTATKANIRRNDKEIISE